MRQPSFIIPEVYDVKNDDNIKRIKMKSVLMPKQSIGNDEQARINGIAPAIPLIRKTELRGNS